jgi:dTMP kinase
MFFSFDGIDGVGKSTQISLFAAYLEEAGHDVVLYRDPGTTRLGEAVRAILLDDLQTEICPVSEMFLYMAARAQLVHEKIKPALEANKVVVSDRFLLANVVYQGWAGGVGADVVWNVGHVATQGIQPDLTFVLDMPPADAADRLGRTLDRMEQRGDTYRQRLREGFLAEAAGDPNHIVVIDASGTIDQVHAAVRQAAQQASV